jgi:AcrR family transcriptional regulator
MDDKKIISFNQNKPIRADAARNRRRLLTTAQRLFDRDSIADVTMSAIAREAGVGKGTLYRHFDDKADLCHALLDEDMRAFQQRTLAHIRSCQDAYTCLRWFLEQTADYVVAHSELLREVANQGGIEMLRHPAHVWWRQTIYGLLVQLQPDGDMDYMADMLYVLLDVQTIRFQRRAQGYNLERIVNGLHMMLDRLLSR